MKLADALDIMWNDLGILGTIEIGAISLLNYARYDCLGKEGEYEPLVKKSWTDMNNLYSGDTTIKEINKPH